MKILHTSDWHLGITLKNISLARQQSHFIDTFADIVRTHKPDAVIIAGDIFDRSVASAETMRLYERAVTELCANLGVTVIIIAGNHDGAQRLALYRDFLSRSGLHITGKLTDNITPVQIGNADIYPVPFFSTDEVRFLYPDKEIKTYTDAMRTVCDAIAEKMDTSRQNIIAAHAYVSGAELAESDTAAVIGSAQAVPCELFKRFDYAAMGHLHRCQRVGENVYYSGSPIKYSKSEIKGEKSVIMIDTDDMSVEYIPIEPMNEMRVVRGTYEEILAGAESEPSDDFIYAELTDQAAEIYMLGNLREYYPNIVMLTGTSAESGGEEISLTVDEAESMSPELLLKSFFKEIFDAEVTEEELKLFNEATEFANGEEGDQ